MPRGSVLVALVALAALAVAACDDKRAASGADGGRTYAAVDAGPLRQCGKAEDCASHGAGSVCYFPTSDIDSPIGFCGGPAPPCKASQPYCTASGRTVWACTFPTEQWMQKGPCGDASTR